MALTYAKLVEALPNVANTSDRDARFPTPDKGQKVYVQSAGSIQFWDGATWQTVILGPGTAGSYLYSGTGSPEGVVTAAVASIYFQTDGTNGNTLWLKRAGTGNTGWMLVAVTDGRINVKAMGAKGDDSTDDTTILQAALTAAGAAGGGTVYLPTGTYKFTATLTVPANVRVQGEGFARTIFKRYFNGTCFTITGVANTQFSDFAINGQAMVYTGKGFVVTGTGSTRPVFSNLYTIDLGAATDTHLEFGADAGQLAAVTNWTFRRLSGSLDFRAIHFNGPDTTACLRTFSQVNVGNGYIDASGAQDTQFSASAFGRIETSATTSILLVVGCVWANLGVAMTLNGSIMNVIGCRFAGSLTLSATYLGTFVGNSQTNSSYTFTNNSTLAGLCVLHSSLADQIVRMYQDFELEKALRFLTASGKVIPGATDLNFRNNADTANNLILADAGDLTVVRGALAVGANASASERDIYFNSAVAIQQALEYRVANVRRWRWFKEADAESGSDAGSTIKLDAYTDAGVRIDTVLQIVRAANGLATWGRPLVHRWPTVSKTGTYTAGASDFLILCDATSGSFTINLPAVASSTGMRFIIKKTDSSANTVTIDGNAAETIDGATTKVLTTQWELADIQTNGTAWFVVGN